MTGRGRHTSSSALALRAADDAPDGSWIIDTPGIRSFGLAHVEPDTDLDGVPRPGRGHRGLPARLHARRRRAGVRRWTSAVAAGTRGPGRPGRLASLRRLLGATRRRRSPGARQRSSRRALARPGLAASPAAVAWAMSQRRLELHRRPAPGPRPGRRRGLPDHGPLQGAGPAGGDQARPHARSPTPTRPSRRPSARTLSRRAAARRRPRRGVRQTGHGPRRWVIDPIDGTKNFVRGVPVWATLIALVDDDEVGGRRRRPRRRWQALVGGQGRRRLHRPSLDAATRLQVSDVARLEDASLSYSASPAGRSAGSLDDFLALPTPCWRTRAYGDFWSYMLVAEGAVDIAAEPELELYDMAALVADRHARPAAASPPWTAGRPRRRQRAGHQRPAARLRPGDPERHPRRGLTSPRQFAVPAPAVPYLAMTKNQGRRRRPGARALAGAAAVALACTGLAGCAGPSLPGPPPDRRPRTTPASRWCWRRSASSRTWSARLAATGWRSSPSPSPVRRSTATNPPPRTWPRSTRRTWCWTTGWGWSAGSNASSATSTPRTRCSPRAWSRSPSPPAPTPARPTPTHGCHPSRPASTSPTPKRRLRPSAPRTPGTSPSARMP